MYRHFQDNNYTKSFNQVSMPHRYIHSIPCIFKYRKLQDYRRKSNQNKIRGKIFFIIILFLFSILILKKSHRNCQYKNVPYKMKKLVTYDISSAHMLIIILMMIPINPIISHSWQSHKFFVAY